VSDNPSLDERIADLNELAGGLAHEIKNPLSTMALNLALLREDWETPQTSKEKRTLKKIALLEREVKRLETILDDFLRFARVQKLKIEPVDLHQVLQEVIDFVGPEARKNNIEVRTFFSNNLPAVPLDAEALRQVLLNLLVNARDAMPEGGELILCTRQDQKSVFVEITDTGEGMSPDAAEHCFDIYFSTKRGGTGLGLPTAKRLVEYHGGTINVKSEQGKGTQFVLQLPLKTPAAKA